PGPSPWPSYGSPCGMARLGRTVPSPWPSCGSGFQIARLGRRGPSPATSCGSHCVLGGGSEGGRSPPPSALQVSRRPHDGPPHVGRWALVEAQALLRLPEVAADDVRELVQLHPHVGVDGVG